jgi:hypothetical protein
MNIPDELYGEIMKYLDIKNMNNFQRINKHLFEQNFNTILYQRYNNGLTNRFDFYEHYDAGKILNNATIFNDQLFSLLEHEHVLYYNEIYDHYCGYFKNEIHYIILLTLDKHSYYRLYIFQPVVTPDTFTPELYYDDEDYDKFVLIDTIKYLSLNEINRNDLSKIPIYYTLTIMDDLGKL